MTDLLEVIERLRKLGFSIIPIKMGGKKPAVAWKAYQARPATREELDGWFANGRPYNIGIVTGAVSHIVVVDYDTPEAIVWADTHLPLTPMMTRTSRGQHCFYRHPGRRVRNRARIDTGDQRIQIDVRGDGGYVVAPGSVHETGHLYEMNGNWPDTLDDVPVFNPAWLASGLKTPTARSGADGVQAVAEGRRNDRLASLAGSMRRPGMSREAITAALLAENRVRCQPPLADSEVEGIASSVSSYVAAANQPVYPLTDAGNGEFIANQYGDLLRFDHRRDQWLKFENHRWTPDVKAEVRGLATLAMRDRYQQAGRIEDVNDRKRAANHAMASESRKGIEAALYFAKAQPRIADGGDDWDRDPMLIGCPNGVIELATGLLRPGRREDRITLQTRALYDPEARPPRFERFLEEVFDGDQGLIGFLQRSAGYALTGLTTEQCLWFFWGKGANGKSTLAGALSHTLGDYAYTAPFSTFERHQRSSVPNDLATLAGRRFVIASETREGTKLHEGRLKSMTGGDALTARFLNREFFTFDPTMKLFLCVNHLPVVEDDSLGWWRRVRLVPFKQTFGLDRTLADALKGEAEGILAWAVQGCLKWRQDGLQPPSSVLAATEMYQEDSDPLGDFLASCCDMSERGEIRAKDFYELYAQWADREGLGDRERLTVAMFGRRMSQRFETVKTNAGKRYRGIGKRAV